MCGIFKYKFDCLPGVAECGSRCRVKKYYRHPDRADTRGCEVFEQTGKPCDPIDKTKGAELKMPTPCMRHLVIAMNTDWRSKKWISDLESVWLHPDVIVQMYDFKNALWNEIAGKYNEIRSHIEKQWLVHGIISDKGPRGNDPIEVKLAYVYMFLMEKAQLRHADFAMELPREAKFLNVHYYFTIPRDIHNYEPKMVRARLLEIESDHKRDVDQWLSERAQSSQSGASAHQPEESSSKRTRQKQRKHWKKQRKRREKRDHVCTCICGEEWVVG